MTSIEDEVNTATAHLSTWSTGTAEQNPTYIGERLLYKDKVEHMDPTRSGSVLLELIKQWAVFQAAVFLAIVFVGFLWLVVFGLTFLADNALFDALRVLLGVVWVLLLFGGFVASIYAFFRKATVGNSEWIMLLDDQGAAADQVFDHISGAFQRRDTPARSLRVKRVPVGGGKHRNLLEAKYDQYTGYVTAYAFGRDLHIGWVYYCHLSLVQYAVLAFKAMVNAVRGRGSELHVLARYEPAKTMREALHAAAREGVDAAATGQFRPSSSIQVDVVATAPEGAALFG